MVKSDEEIETGREESYINSNKLAKITPLRDVLYYTYKKVRSHPIRLCALRRTQQCQAHVGP